MSKLFKSIGNLFAKMFKGLWVLIKKGFKCLITRTFLALGVVLSWVVPIWLLAEKVALTKTVNTGVKLSFVGMLVVLVVLLAMWKKIVLKINTISTDKVSGLLFKMLLKTLHKGIVLGAILILIDKLSKLLIVVLQWYEISLIPISIGFVCYLIDMVIVFKKQNRG